MLRICTVLYYDTAWNFHIIRREKEMCKNMSLFAFLAYQIKDNETINILKKRRQTMKTALKIQYQSALSYQYSLIEVFFQLCGVFVYDGKDENVTKRDKTQTDQLLIIELNKVQSIQEIYEEIKQKLQVTSVEDQYMDWLWNLYYIKDTNKNLFWALFKVDSLSETKLQKTEVSLLKNILKQIEGVSDYSCYSRYYGMTKLQYILCCEKISKGMTIETELHKLALLCHKAQTFGKEKLPITELMGDININVINDYSLGLTYYKMSITDYNYKVLRKIARYYESRTIDPRRELKYLERAIQCRPEYYEARYRLARKMEREQFRFEAALKEYEAIADKLGSLQRINWLTPVEFQVLCRIWKRIGCISYKYLQAPAYEYSLQTYQKIYKLRENCDKNKFIQSMFPEKQEEAITLYKDLSPIEHVQLSEKNIRRKMRELSIKSNS